MKHFLRKSTSLATVVAAFLVFATAANANTIVFNNALEAGSQDNYVLGMDFTVNSDVYVTQLGAFDDLGNGFALGTTIQVGIFTTAGALVGTSALFTNATPGNLVGGSRFVSIAPFALVAGNYSIVAAGFTPGSRSGNTGLGGTQPFFDTLGGALALVPKGGRWNDQFNNVFQLPTQNSGGYAQADPVFLAGTFAAAVPDGGSASMMLGFGLLAAGFVRRLIK